MKEPFDEFADYFWLTTTPYGCTLTVYRTMPAEGEAEPKRELVGRLRMGHQLAVELRDLIAKNVHVAVIPEPDPKAPKH